MTTDKLTGVEESTGRADSITASGVQTHPLAEAGREAGESAAHLAERATELGIGQADRGREQAATGVEQVADSIRRVSLDIQAEQPAIADAAETAAEQAERIARYLRETEAREIIGTVEDMARRQPLVFLGGAFVLGFVAARFIKAGGGLGTSPQGRQLSSGNGAHHTSTTRRVGSYDYQSTDAGEGL